MRLNNRTLLKIKWKNRLLTLALLGLMCAGVWLLGRWILGDIFALYAVFLVMTIIAFNPALSPSLLMRAYRAQPVKPQDAYELCQIVAVLAKRAHLPTTPKLYYLPIGTMNAFAAGSQSNSVIALSDGLLRNLTLNEITGVIAHEISHIRHNDMLIMIVSDLMGQITRLLAFIGQLFLLLAFPMLVMGAIEIDLLPFAIVILTPLLSALIQLAISRSRELQADVSAAELLGTPEPLINALIKLERQSSYWERFYRASSDNALLRTHPTTKERIEQLDALSPDASWQPLGYQDGWTNPWSHSPQLYPRRISRYLWF